MPWVPCGARSSRSCCQRYWLRLGKIQLLPPLKVGVHGWPFEEEGAASLLNLMAAGIKGGGKDATSTSTETRQRQAGGAGEPPKLPLNSAFPPGG